MPFVSPTHNTGLTIALRRIPTAPRSSLVKITLRTRSRPTATHDSAFLTLTLPNAFETSGGYTFYQHFLITLDMLPPSKAAEVKAATHGRETRAKTVVITSPIAHPLE
jgi:hypothetical protein